MRSSRLLRMLLRLSAHGRVSAPDLAAEFEVSVRTIYRDVEALSAAGIPVYAVRGRAGGICLLHDYRTRLTGMSAREAEAMFLAGVPGVAAELGMGAVLGTTSHKLLAALPAGQRERAARIRDRFHLDAPGWLRNPVAPRFLELVAEAVWSGQTLQARYEHADRSVVERTLSPLGLVLKAGTWYLVAMPVGAGRGPRVYRVSRVHAAQPVGPAEPGPPGFELQTFWAQYQRDYAERVYGERAVIRISPAGLELLFLLGAIPAATARERLGDPDATGWFTTELAIESVRHAQHALAQLGADVEVLAPSALRTAMSAQAQAVAALYAVGGEPSS